MPCIYSSQIKTDDNYPLTLKAPITTAADDIHIYFFLFFSEEIRLDVSSVPSARQRIQMKKIKAYLIRKIQVKIKMSSAAIFVWRFKG